MKLRELSLKSFRSYRNVTLELAGPHVLIAGQNGTGKTSCREALKWCLTGHCTNTDGKGAGAEALIPVGSKMAEVSCVVDGIGRITRTYAEKGGGSFSVEGLTGTSQIQQQGLYIKLNTQASFVDAALSTEAFLDLTHIEAKALVLSLLNVRIPVGDESYTLDEADVRYKQAFEERKSAKRELANCVVPTKPDGNFPPEDAIEAQLVKLRKALGDVRQAIGETLGKRATLNAEMTRALSVLPPEKDPDRDLEIGRLQAELTALETTVPQTIAPPKGDPKRLAFLRGEEQEIATFVPSKGCIMGHGIPCNTQPAVFALTVSEIHAEIASLEAVKTPMTVIISPAAQIRDALNTLQGAKARYDVGMATFQTAKDREKAIRAELKALPKTDDQEADILVLEGRIAKGESFLRDSRAFRQALEAHQKATSARQAREAEVDRLEALVEVLGPNGARVGALASAVERFQEAVNPYVKPFGWKLSFAVDPWEVRANDRPVETYSRSERYRIGIALQLGIAQLSGLRMACVDEIDMLDLENRGIVTKMLLAAGLDQILVLGTREATQALPKGLTAFRLSKEDGRTVVTERQAA